MVHVQSFESLEEARDAIRRGVEAAKARATARQNAITYGDHWMRIWDAGYGETYLICGRVSTLEESDPRKFGADEAEALAEEADMRASYDDGFRFGRAYSEIEPDGELGDTHVSDMIPITADEFEDAKAHGWRLSEVQPLEWFQNRLVDEINYRAAR